MEDITEYNLYSLKFAEHLFSNIQYVEYSDNIADIQSYSDYYFSRFAEKLFMCASNLNKITNLIERVEFSDTAEIIVRNPRLQKVELESNLDLIALVLRQLIEMYLDLKTLILAQKKVDNLPVICSALIFSARLSVVEEQLRDARDFSKCEPKNLVMEANLLKDAIGEFRQKASAKGFLFLKKLKGKFDGIAKSSEFDKILLGTDFVSLYSLISKKVHFSINATFAMSAIGLPLYVKWTAFYLFEVYFETLKLLKIPFTDEVSEVYPAFEERKNSLSLTQLNLERFSKLPIIICSYGIAQILEIRSFSVKISYLLSSVFEAGTEDEIPTHFVAGIIESKTFSAKMVEYCGKDDANYCREKLISEKMYEVFWKDVLSTKT